MLISVNGVEKKVESELIVAQLVSELKLKGRFAIEINGEIVPKSSYLKKILKENDRIEIVSAVGGG
ncbi:MAG: sulfur carrier protein ThiS [Pseudomonadota bacterium]|nr:sulfur carrier protein ThiS [Pseudomonadota bacterium]